MDKIFKYVTEIENPFNQIFTIEMPVGSSPLSCELFEKDRRLHVIIWAIVNPEAARAKKKFYVIATGETFDKRVKIFNLIGRVEYGLLPYIYHVFSVAGDK